MEPTQPSAARAVASAGADTNAIPHTDVALPTGLDPGGSWALAGGRWHWGRPELSDDPAVLDGTGRWIVCLPADGQMVAARFPHSAPLQVEDAKADVAGRFRSDEIARPSAEPKPAGSDPLSSWDSSLSRPEYSTRVEEIRALIAAGDVYQVNLTRRLSGPTRPDHPGASALALTAALAATHRAPFGASLCLPELGLWVVGASPERFLSRSGALVTSEPIKGTAPAAELLTAKDRAENVMICDLVRNDLGRVCSMGTVEVPDLLRLEAHPGLVHLVTTVSGRLRPDVGWTALLAAVFPPGSVTGAPKLAALEVIDALEPQGRGPYCGALGWVDADSQTADLAVSIRTFWASGDDSGGGSGGDSDGDSGAVASSPMAWRWTFGTGGAITWDSNAEDEWAETELKARRLLELAEGPLATRGPPLSPPDAAVRAW